jgi:hypothetical protein
MPCACSNKANDVNSKSIVFYVKADVSAKFIDSKGNSYIASGSASATSDVIDLAKNEAKRGILVVLKNLKKPNFKVVKESVKLNFTDDIKTN